LGPVLGAAIISVSDWRMTFWLLAALTIVLTAKGMRRPTS
jgi:predicted MFS family arabinose efflux permease